MKWGSVSYITALHSNDNNAVFGSGFRAALCGLDLIWVNLLFSPSPFPWLGLVRLSLLCLWWSVMRAAPGGFLVLPWPGSGSGASDPELEVEVEGRWGLLRCGAVLGITLICKNLIYLMIIKHQLEQYRATDWTCPQIRTLKNCNQHKTFHMNLFRTLKSVCFSCFCF